MATHEEAAAYNAFMQQLLKNGQSTSNVSGSNSARVGGDVPLDTDEDTDERESDSDDSSDDSSGQELAEETDNLSTSRAGPVKLVGGWYHVDGDPSKLEHVVQEISKRAGVKVQQLDVNEIDDMKYKAQKYANQLKKKAQYRSKPEVKKRIREYQAKPEVKERKKQYATECKERRAAMQRQKRKMVRAILQDHPSIAIRYREQFMHEFDQKPSELKKQEKQGGEIVEQVQSQNLDGNSSSGGPPVSQP